MRRMPVFEFAGDGLTSAMSGIRPKVAEWRMMRKAADDLDQTSTQPAPMIRESAAFAYVSRHDPPATEIRTTTTLSAQPSTSMQPDRRRDDDERRDTRHADRQGAMRRVTRRFRMWGDSFFDLRT